MFLERFLEPKLHLPAQLTIETLRNMSQVNNKDTRTMSALLTSQHIR